MSEVGGSKKTKLNSFARFMFAYKAKEEAKGRVIDMNTATIEAGRIWQGMSEAEKGQRSKPGNQPALPEMPKKEIQAEPKSETMSKDQKVKIAIDELLKDPAHDTKIFYFISVEHFLKANGYVWPCELALCKFTLQDGVIDTKHILINPGKLPLGFAGDASTHAQKTHRIDLPNENTTGETDYKKIFKSIMDFIGARKFEKPHLPPLFTAVEDEEIDVVEIALDIFAQESGYDFNAFTIYPIDQLLLKLQNKCAEIQKNLEITPSEPLRTTIAARDAIYRDCQFAYSLNGCDFHNEIDFPYNCCLSKVQRWAYTIAKYCLDERYEYMPGGHGPSNFHPTIHVNLEKTLSILSDDDYHSVHAQSTDGDQTDDAESVSGKSQVSRITSHAGRPKYVIDENAWLKKFLRKNGIKVTSSDTSIERSDSDVTFTDIDDSSATEQ